MEDEKQAGQRKSEESEIPPEIPPTTQAKRDIGDLEEHFSLILAAKSELFRPRRRKRVKRTSSRKKP